MAVSALPRPHPTAPVVTASLPAGVLLLALAAPALDLLGVVQPITAGLGLALAASVASAVVLLAFYMKFPRTSWLAAAALAACASAALRLVGADDGPALSLLAVIALGVGGAFASSSQRSEIWLA
jgi:hypothetical protein